MTRKVGDLVTVLLINDGPMTTAEIAKRLRSRLMAYLTIDGNRKDYPHDALVEELKDDERFVKDGTGRWVLTNAVE